ncbi:MAG: precorrin-6A synthase (deacetylating) [Parvibaculaceae bacterium]
MKRKVLVIGIGAGNPEHMTVQAIGALNRASVLFIPDKGADKNDLQRVRREICERFIGKPGYRMVDFDVPERRQSLPAYRDNIEVWRDKVEAVYERLLTDELQEDEWGAFLVWGDPSIYDGTLRILDHLRASGRLEIECEVIPGISSVQALAASHRVALNRIGQSILLTTGRRLKQGLPQGAENVVVMLDGDSALKSADPDLHIHWAAYAGMPEEILVSGRLGDVVEEIEWRKAEARARHGWIMDSYLLTRASDGEE